MSVSEQQRLHLFKTLEQSLGDEDAATMMALLPPAGWADVATKHDLAALRAEVRADMLELEVRLERTVRSTVLAGMGIQTAVIGILVALS